MNKFIFRHECDGRISCVEFNEESIDEIIEEFRYFLLACSFSPSLVNRSLGRDEDLEWETAAIEKL